MLGGLKVGAAVSPLFSAFGPEPIATRVNLGRGKVLVTTEALFQKKVAKIAVPMPTLEHVLRVDSPEFRREFEAASPRLRGRAHGCGRHVLPALHQRHHRHARRARCTCTARCVMHYATGQVALDLHPDDVFWCTADPGWVTGTSYGIVTPLVHGVTSIVDEADFDAERWYRILEEERVSVWYTAPTAIRMLMKAGAELAKQHAFPHLRFVASVGEPLNPEAVWWGMDALGMPIHDNWWQTETGGIMIANIAAMDVKPGSMGKPLPGVEAAIAHRDDDRHRAGRRATTRRASSRCAPAGRRCSAATSTRRSATASASRTAGTSPATSRSATPTATSGSWAAPTT